VAIGLQKSGWKVMAWPQPMAGGLWLSANVAIIAQIKLSIQLMLSDCLAGKYLQLNKCEIFGQ